MKKDIKRLTVLIGLPLLLAVGLAVGLAMAGTEVKDVIMMENQQAYDKHTLAIVTFTHKKHNEEYKLGCGECHHDKDAKPLVDLKAGDNVQPCLECHTNTGKPDKKALRAIADENARAKEELKYHFTAIHENCQGCHEKYNVEKAGDKRKGPAPVACTQCHPKPEK